MFLPRCACGSEHCEPLGFLEAQLQALPQQLRRWSNKKLPVRYSRHSTDIVATVPTFQVSRAGYAKSGLTHRVRSVYALEHTALLGLQVASGATLPVLTAVLVPSDSYSWAGKHYRRPSPPFQGSLMLSHPGKSLEDLLPHFAERRLLDIHACNLFLACLAASLCFLQKASHNLFVVVPLGTKP